MIGCPENERDSIWKMAMEPAEEMVTYICIPLMSLGPMLPEDQRLFLLFFCPSLPKCHLGLSCSPGYWGNWNQPGLLDYCISKASAFYLSPKYAFLSRYLKEALLASSSMCVAQLGQSVQTLQGNGGICPKFLLSKEFGWTVCVCVWWEVVKRGWSDLGWWIFPSDSPNGALWKRAGPLSLWNASQEFINGQGFLTKE